ncbi:MAG TPA: hypothetical protein VK753_12855 [Xanthomonadaceae bacterium]|nr:hypothetical protein [Xanthomonadaceae bacterium]
MGKLIRNAVFALALLPATALAAPYFMGVVQIAVPAGFEGPVTQQPDSKSTVSTFVKRYPHDTRGTLLEITTYEVGAQLKSMPESMRTSTTDAYLKQMLDGVAKKRDSFKTSPTAHIRMSGVLASREAWSGVVQGQNMSGTMYCAILGGVVVFFHTQDFDDAPADNRAQAVRAIESVAFKRERD